MMRGAGRIARPYNWITDGRSWHIASIPALTDSAAIEG